MKRIDALPPNLAPRGLGRVEAAAYVGISVNTFDNLVNAGQMPPPKIIGARKIWDRHAVDKAFAALPDQNGNREYDDVWSRVAV